MELRQGAHDLRAMHRRHYQRVAAVKRRFAQALVLVMAFLIIVAEVQRVEDAEAMRAAYQMYGDGEP